MSYFETTQLPNNLEETIYEIIDRLAVLGAVRGTAQDLRVTLLSGVVSTVSSLSNQVQNGGYYTTAVVQNYQNNIAVQSNINNVAS